MGGKLSIFVAFVLVGAGIGMYWYFSIYKTYLFQMQQKDNEIATIDQQLKANANIDTDITNQIKEKEKLSIQIENLRKWFGKGDYTPKVLKVMELTAKKYDIKMKDIKFNPLVEYDGYSELSIEISFEGRYHKFGQFLADIENKRLVNINDAVINLTPRGNPQYNKETREYDILNLNISVSVKAYILHDVGVQGG